MSMKTHIVVIVFALAASCLSQTRSQKNPFQVQILEPILAGQREIALGLVPQRLDTFGFYHSFLVGAGVRGGGDIQWNADRGAVTSPIPASPMEESVRIGGTSWSVKPAVIGSQIGTLFEADGFRNQHVEMNIGRTQTIKQDIRNFQKRTYFVGDDGKIIWEKSEVRNEKGVWLMEAKYGPDSYDLHLVTPTGEKKMTVNPGPGVDAIHAQFKPMLKGQDILLKEKEFYVLDPYTGTPKKYTAKVAGRFGGKFSDMMFEGRYIDIEGEGSKTRAYISYEGTMLRVDAPGNTYLHIEQAPETKPTLRHKKGGTA